MNEFTKRGEAFEGKFAHEEAMRFKAIARRNKLIGLWAAQRLGKSARTPKLTRARWSSLI